MNTKFNSQICTTREQSERLLSLGLKKETADMCWTKMAAIRGTYYVPELAPINMVSWRHTPAWSLHRLISLTNTDDIKIACNEKHCWGGNVLKIAQRKAFEKDNLYDNIIDCIEWLIKEGYFNKEYLV